MALIRWVDPSEMMEPMADLDRLRQEVSRLFDTFTAPAPAFSSRVYPSINITEDDDNYYLRAELPGVKSEDLELTVVGNRVSVRGERKIDSAKEGADYHRREREGGVFRRTVSLPTEVASNKVNAEMKDGILKVTLPKQAEAKARKIEIKPTR